jgi:hypothetical protein
MAAMFLDALVIYQSFWAVKPGEFLKPIELPV